ncbi:hypothetical protein QCD71_23860 [Sphingomonas sp. PsM26]|nr:hypothetical protein [Sphingomonas sp. PsM26]
MTNRIHTLMQAADDGDVVAGQPKIDNVLLNTALPIAWSNVGSSLRLLRTFSQVSTDGFDEIGIAQGLRQAPVRYGIIEHPFEIALRPRLSRYPAMLRSFALLERDKVERLRLATLLALNQHLPDAFDLEGSFLLAPD